MSVLVLHCLHGCNMSDLHPFMNVLVLHYLHGYYLSDLHPSMNVLVFHCLHSCYLSDLRRFMNVLVLHCLHGYNMNDNLPFINILTTLTSEVTRAPESETAKYIWSMRNRQRDTEARTIPSTVNCILYFFDKRGHHRYGCPSYMMAKLPITGTAVPVTRWQGCPSYLMTRLNITHTAVQVT